MCNAEFYPGGDSDLRPWILTIDDLTDEELDRVAEIVAETIRGREKKEGMK